MPFDAPRWQIELAAVDRTAAAFASVNRNMRTLQATERTTSSAMTAGFGVLSRTLAPLAAGFTAAAMADKVWQAGMKAADLGEQAEQIGLTTDALQAYRFQAAQNGVEVGQLDTAMMRLTATMGAAEKGGEAEIALFDRLGVKLHDTQGELRSVGDVLPEVARGILSIGSESQRNAALIDLFGRSGSRMVTMLGDWSRGNEALIASAKRQGGVLDADVIAKWDQVSDSMKRAEQAANVTFAALGAPIATGALEHFANVVAATKDGIDKLGGAWRYVRNLFTNDATMDMSVRQDTLRAQLENLKDSTDALDIAKVAQIKRDLAEIGNTLASRANVVTLPPISVTPSVGVSNPPLKTGGGSSAAQPRVIDEAAKAAEKLAAWMKDANVSFDAFMAGQEVERRSLFLSKEAAMALRLETELLNKAKADDVALTGEQTQQISGWAAQMAASAETTRQLTETVEVEKETFKGFFTDLNQGAREGAKALDILGNAGENALGRISDKLLDMALNNVWSAAFPGGGLLGGILGGGAAGATSAGLFDGLFSAFFGSPFMFAEGGRPPVGTPYIVGERGPEVRVDDRPGQIFNRRQWNAMAGAADRSMMGFGEIRGFAGGGRPPVDAPYIVGELGPEVRVDDRPGQIFNRRQWNALTGGGRDGGGQRQRIEIVLLSDMLDARIAEGADVRIVRATPRLMSSTLDQVPGKMAQHRRDVDGGDHRLG